MILATTTTIMIRQTEIIALAFALIALAACDDSGPLGTDSSDSVDHRFDIPTFYKDTD